MRANKLLPWIGVAVIWGTVIFGGVSGTFLSPLYSLCGAVLLALLVTQPRFLLMLTAILMAGEFTLPNLPSPMSLYLLTGLLFCVSVILERFLHRGENMTTVERRIMYWVMGFAFVLIVTAGIRGSGLKLLGNDKWGGRPYVLLLFASAILIQSMYVKLTKVQCKRMIMGMCIAGLFPTLAAVATCYGGTDILSQFVIQTDEYLKFKTGMTGNMEPGFRLQMAHASATYMFLLMWMVMYLGGLRSRIAMGICALAGIFLAGASGNRLALLYGVVLCISFIILNTRTSLAARLLNRYTLLLAITLTMLVLFSTELPLVFQRSISLIPFANVAPDIQMDASTTSLWRIEVWKLALKELPHYLLLGKGFAFHSEDVLSYVNWSMSDYSYVVASHNYHNGVVHILIDLGLPGMLFSAGFIIFVFRSHYRLLSARWNNSMLCHFHHVVLASFMTQVIVHLMVGGDATSFVFLLFLTIILTQLVRADAALNPATVASP